MAKLGWGDETIGKKIGFSKEVMRPIVGTVKDFHYRSLKHVIGPLAIFLRPRGDSYLSIKMNTDNISATLSYIEKTWNAFEKERSFGYFFVDENFDSLYHSEEQLSQIITFFASIAIFVACLGLFGLASYTAEQSTKEIGIRKVLGATASSIVVLLSRNFLKWVLVANLIAWPVTYYVMKNYWLANFPFRIPISLLTFFMGGIIALFIALLTVSYQSIKAAVANPIDSLRYE
jgi:putative ABC transport system permease protein